MGLGITSVVRDVDVMPQTLSWAFLWMAAKCERLHDLGVSDGLLGYVAEREAVPGEFRFQIGARNQGWMDAGKDLHGLRNLASRREGGGRVRRIFLGDDEDFVFGENAEIGDGAAPVDMLENEDGQNVVKAALQGGTLDIVDDPFSLFSPNAANLLSQLAHSLHCFSEKFSRQLE